MAEAERTLILYTKDAAGRSLPSVLKCVADGTLTLITQCPDPCKERTPIKVSDEALSVRHEPGCVKCGKPIALTSPAGYTFRAAYEAVKKMDEENRIVESD